MKLRMKNELGVLADNQLSPSVLCNHVVRRAKAIFFCVRRIASKGSKEVVLLLHLASVKAIGIMSVLMSAAQEGCWQIGGSSEKNHKSMKEKKKKALKWSDSTG